jgi:hypothetical protein
MKLQTLVESDSHIESVEEFLKEKYPERYSLIDNWEELDMSLELKELGEGKYLLLLNVEEGEFEKTLGIFGSLQEAMGAFLTTAEERGWERVPESYAVYHAHFERDVLIAGIKTEEGISKYNQMSLEQMMEKLVRYPRIVVYSSDVLTYIKDLFPEVDRRAYVIAREIAKRVGSAPELEELGKIYGIDTSSLEGKIELIDRLIKSPVKLPSGEIELKPIHYPLEA